MIGKLKFFYTLFFCYVLIVGNVLAQDFSDAENAIIRKANTSRFAIYHGRKMKEFVRLMNLARLDPDLCARYISVEYQIDPGRLKVVKNFRPRANIEKLRPSLGLHLSAWIHAVFSGWSGNTGHQKFELRKLMFLNFSTITGFSGENCEYGSKDAVDIFLSLMHSPGHRANILNRYYSRVGVSKKWHVNYKRNTVSVFSGPTFWDKLFKR